jgi:hypothetical protein
MTAASVALFPLFAGPGRPARVLGIVEGAVYLQIDALARSDSRDGLDHPGGVVALLDRDAVQLPIGIVLPEAASALIPVSVAGSPVSQGEITVGWGAITLAGTRWPVLRWWNPGVPKLELPASVELPIEAEFALPQLREGLAALVSGDGERAVLSLVGAGPGLTPAGDDVLCGALSALAAWAPDSAIRRDLAAAVIAAVDRTTPISAALLQSAVTGCAVPELIRLLTALSASDGPQIDGAMGELAEVGASSGVAMAAGAVQQLQALLADPARADPSHSDLARADPARSAFARADPARVNPVQADRNEGRAGSAEPRIADGTVRGTGQPSALCRSDR